MTSSAMSMRPAALMRGAMRKPTSVAVGGRSRGRSATRMSSRRPGWTGLRRACEAEGARTRFSPIERDGVGDGGDGDELEERWKEAGVEVGEGGRGIGLGVGVCEQEGVGEFEG